jgi:actin-like ATPase involved in cell morphogenesis
VLVHPRIVIGVPSDITQVEKRAVMDSAYRAKASEVHLVEHQDRSDGIFVSLDYPDSGVVRPRDLVEVT